LNDDSGAVYSKAGLSRAAANYAQLGYSSIASAVDCSSAVNRNMDGTAGCFGGKWVNQKDTTAAISASNTATFQAYLYMASQNADFINGFRFFKGQTVMTGYGEFSGGNFGLYSNPVTFSGAFTTVATTAGLVAGVLISFF